jgi:hypothetical protein
MQEYTPKKSNHIVRVVYDETSKEMHVLFKSNPKPYTHVGVPQEHFDAMRKDISAGSYYWQRIVKFFPRKKENQHERSTTTAPA